LPSRLMNIIVSATPATYHSSLINLSGFDLAIASSLILLAGGISLALKLGLESRLAVASLRSVVQLLVVGLILRAVFDIASPLPLLAIFLIMTVVDARTAIGRSERIVTGSFWISFVTLILAGIVSTFTVSGAVIRVEPWYEPRYVIPLLGMVLGNTMSGISLGMDSMLAGFYERRSEIEMELSLGATAWEAAREQVSSAVRRGMIPMINSMMAAGIVALPGAMTGQILAGADPFEAVKYQIVILFMITAATALGCMLTCLLIFKRVFNRRHQLCIDRIHLH